MFHNRKMNYVNAEPRGHARNRRRFILHPRGVKFTSASVAGANPTNAELALAANWVRVWENKNVPVVAVTHNI